MALWEGNVVCYKKQITERGGLCMIQDMQRFIIEFAVKKALRGIEDSPERSIRNLIDLGLEDAGGRFQRQFLTAAGKILEREDSPYYDLAKDALQNVDREKLTTIGINLGYNSCTKGARKIRELEEGDGYSVPWILFLSMDGAALKENREAYSFLLTQGEQLGICTYGIFWQGNPTDLLPLLGEHPGCAFFLCLQSGQISGAFVEAMQSVQNTMITVLYDEAAAHVCQRLRRGRLPYSLLVSYGEDDCQAILDGSRIQSLLPLHPLFLFFRQKLGCPQAVQQQVREYALRVRMNQEFPVMVLELQQVVENIAKIISARPCLMAFSQMGQLITRQKWKERWQYNLFTHDLMGILRAYHAAQAQ